MGVDQPASYSSFYSDIFIGLVPADKSDSQFEVMKDGGSLKDETQPTFQTKNIPVLYFKQTGSYLRSSFEFKMDLMLPAGAVKSAQCICMWISLGNSQRPCSFRPLLVVL